MLHIEYLVWQNVIGKEVVVRILFCAHTGKRHCPCTVRHLYQIFGVPFLKMTVQVHQEEG